MRAKFATLTDAIDAGYRPVSPANDKDISSPGNLYGSRGYDFQDSDGNKTVTVYLAEEANKAGTKGCYVPMFPPKSNE